MKENENIERYRSLRKFRLLIITRHMLKFHTDNFSYKYKLSLLIVCHRKKIRTFKFRTFLVVQKLIQIENFPNYDTQWCKYPCCSTLIHSTSLVLLALPHTREAGEEALTATTVNQHIHVWDCHDHVQVVQIFLGTAQDFQGCPWMSYIATCMSLSPQILCPRCPQTYPGYPGISLDVLPPPRSHVQDVPDILRYPSYMYI